jgi:hypothetical protein
MPSTKVDVDPQLIEKMKVGSPSTPLTAVFILRDKAFSVKNLTSVVTRLVSEAKRKAGKSKSDVHVNVMKNIGAFALEAPPAVIRQLIGRKEISSVEANEPQHELLIN